ncbi:MAG: extracellular solute-binding protein [Paenibacillaceae bacterium]|jgi:putative aldouronate transport system substrate-binding protein|nr:extracellular solute-binding protein [Paenibacillaceae bacterium]
MNTSKSVTAVWSLTLAVSLLLSACGGESASPASTAGAAVTPSATPAVKAEPLGKYDPPIEVSTVRYVDAGFKFPAGDNIDNNIWTRIFEKDYGIKIKNLWTTDITQYRQKLNISIASGELPDILEVNKEEMKRLADADMLSDLTEIWQQYSSPYAKSVLAQDNGMGLKAATFNGKLLGLPRTYSNGGISAASMLYIRTDWLEKLNLQEPKTMEDVFKIATAFAKQDPDGNGKADTIGLAINKEFLDPAHGGLVGYFNSFHAYPGIWVKGADGKLVYGSVQKEMKEPLQKLQDLFKAGVLDKEFGVKTAQKIREDVAAGRVGLAYGYVADGGTGQKDNHTKDPKAQWKALPLVSFDASPAIPQLKETSSNFFVAKKSSKNPEALVKLFNIYVKHYYETSYAPNPNPFISDSATGIFPAKYAPVAIDPLNTNLEAFRQVHEALKKNDGSKLGFPANLHFERLTKFRAGDDSMWYSNMVFGETGSGYSVIEYYDQKKLGHYDQFLSAATSTMSEKLPTLKKKEIEIFTKIIMGDASADEFDKFTDEFKKLGGTAIEQEVNDWFAKNK